MNHNDKTDEGIAAVLAVALVLLLLLLGIGGFLFIGYLPARNAAAEAQMEAVVAAAKAQELSRQLDVTSL